MEHDRLIDISCSIEDSTVWVMVRSIRYPVDMIINSASRRAEEWNEEYIFRIIDIEFDRIEGHVPISRSTIDHI